MEPLDSLSARGVLRSARSETPVRGWTPAQVVVRSIPRSRHEDGYSSRNEPPYRLPTNPIAAPAVPSYQQRQTAAPRCSQIDGRVHVLSVSFSLYASNASTGVGAAAGLWVSNNIMTDAGTRKLPLVISFASPRRFLVCRRGWQFVTWPRSPPRGGNRVGLFAIAHEHYV